MVLTILADDLTGACDAGTLFAGKAPVPMTVWPALDTDGVPDAMIRVLDLETRACPAADAARRARHAAATVSHGRTFKKIDSTLRGHIGAEVGALLDATPALGALVCPAFPAQGRIVVDRLLLVDGRPVAQTAIASDPDFPRPTRPGFSASSVIDLLREQLDRPLAWIPRAQVREGSRALAARLTRLAGTVAVADADCDADLDALVEAALALEAAPLLVGSAGLARPLAARLGLLAEAASLPPARRWLVVAGSLHPTTRAQIRAARAAGMTVFATPDVEMADRRSAIARLADETVRALAKGDFDLLAVTGGETAVAVYRALAARRIDLVGAPAPGLALGYLRSVRHPALPIVTKAGGFGAPDLFVSLARKAAA